MYNNIMNQYPIRTISELTGVSSTTLRAWERRYGLLKPTRTAKGHRLYDSSDIDTINNIVSLIRCGNTISQAIHILDNPVSNLNKEANNNSLNTNNHWLNYQQRMIKAIETFNTERLNAVYNEALSLYPIDTVNDMLITPVLLLLGERWQKRDTGIAEEHFFSAFLRNKLGARLHHESGRARGNTILVSCIEGEHHELGLLLFSIAIMGRGYKVIYLGANLPVSQIPLVTRRIKPAGVLLSASHDFVLSDDISMQLSNCINTLDIPCAFGGTFSDNYQQDIQQLGGHHLGKDHQQALDRLNAIVPVFTR